MSNVDSLKKVVAELERIASEKPEDAATKMAQRFVKAIQAVLDDDDAKPNARAGRTYLSEHAVRMDEIMGLHGGPSAHNDGNRLILSFVGRKR